MATADPILPSRYAAFFQTLIVRGEWGITEVEYLARQHGHMLSGALEALNEWAFDKYGGQLFVEDGERVVVEKQRLS